MTRFLYPWEKELVPFKYASNFFGKKRTFFVYFLDTLTYCWFFSPSIIILTKAEVQKEVLSKRSNWTGWKASQACAQQPSQVDCNIKLTHPTRTIQKLAEDLFGEKRNHLPLFFRKVLDTYSVIENQCIKTILKSCYHLYYGPKLCFSLD